MRYDAGCGYEFESMTIPSEALERMLAAYVPNPKEWIDSLNAFQRLTGGSGYFLVPRKVRHRVFFYRSSRDNVLCGASCRTKSFGTNNNIGRNN